VEVSVDELGSFLAEQVRIVQDRRATSPTVGAQPVQYRYREIIGGSCLEIVFAYDTEEMRTARDEEGMRPHLTMVR
jgi:hypothetical protein